MKNFIKKIIENLFYLFIAEKNDKKILKKIDKYKYVSFDIFDTLIKRSVGKPSDVFTLVEKNYNENNSEKISNFMKNRINAEKKALRLSKCEEVTLDEIYSKINAYSMEQLRLLKQMEMNIEYDICKEKNLGKKLFDYCVENNKKIIITSDMYLSKEFIKKILNKNGYKDYNSIFISSSEKLTKRSGNIYRKILKKMKINSNEIIHIGDHPISDYINAKKNKINSILIEK